MILLDGKSLKEKIISELRDKVSDLSRKPGLAVIQIGEDEASKVYLRQKEKMANTVGYNFHYICFSDLVKEEEIILKIEELNANDDICSILVQMPINRKYNVLKIQNSILPEKDVDGISHYNIGALVNNSSYCKPCTALGIIELLAYNKIEIAGKNVVIVGRSNLVGRPLSVIMTNMDATVTLCHSKTNNLSYFTTMADILVVAVGKKHLIKEDMVKENAVIIDVGINKIDSNIYGDVDFDSVKDKCSYITPVPGGVGPMTIAMLAKNVYELYILQNKDINVK